MGKAKKSATGKKTVSASQYQATQVIKMLAKASGIELTSVWASRKVLRPEVDEIRDTMWGVKDGEKVLVVLNHLGTEIKGYPTPEKKFPNMHSVKF